MATTTKLRQSRLCGWDIITAGLIWQHGNEPGSTGSVMDDNDALTRVLGQLPAPRAQQASEETGSDHVAGPQGLALAVPFLGDLIAMQSLQKTSRERCRR